MGLYEYNQLSLPEQLGLLWENGVFLFNRREEAFGINLYQVSDFYVESWLDDKQNKITKVRAFKNISQLEPYLENIDIKDKLR